MGASCFHLFCELTVPIFCSFLLYGFVRDNVHIFVIYIANICPDLSLGFCFLNCGDFKRDDSKRDLDEVLTIHSQPSVSRLNSWIPGAGLCNATLYKGLEFWGSVGRGS